MGYLEFLQPVKPEIRQHDAPESIAAWSSCLGL